MFPSLVFRHAYDQLQAALPQPANREYLRVLHLAASTAEYAVERALALCLKRGTMPTSEAIRAMVQPAQAIVVPDLTPAVLDLSTYDHLLAPNEVRP